MKEKLCSVFAVAVGESCASEEAMDAVIVCANKGIPAKHDNRFVEVN